MKINPLLFSAIVLVGIGLLPKVQAVNPPPDGGYPGGNTAEGQSALLSRTTGLYNTGIGIYSLLSLTAGNFCTGVGAGTLLVNTADQNTATGAGALLSNSIGGFNTANGAFALFNHTAGDHNTAVGTQALFSDLGGADNTAIGYQALFSNIGDILAVQNTAVGAQALLDNTDGNANTAVGFQALSSNLTGSSNTAIGTDALFTNTDGDGNTANGQGALFSNTEGFLNTANGYHALFNSTTGAGNTAIGEQALRDNTTSDANTGIGDNALSNSTGNNNTALGFSAGFSVTTASHVICIGTQGANVSNSCFIDNIYSQSSPSGTAVFVNVDGKLGTTVSSQRFKDDIKPMDKTSEAILAFKPVTFHYKKDFDPTGIAQFGLVAEDVEQVNPDLVVHDKEGKPYSVRYDQINAMLLNEFLKEHKKVEQLRSTVAKQKAAIVQQRRDFEITITELKKEIETVVSHSKDQDAKIQRVSAQIELSRPATQLADDD